MTQTPLDQFLDAAFWTDSTEKAAAILARHPEIGTASIHAAAVLGERRVMRDDEEGPRSHSAESAIVAQR